MANMANIDAYDARNGNFRDLRDLGDLHAELTERQNCANCGERAEEIVTDSGEFVTVHADRGQDMPHDRVFCSPVSADSAKAELIDPLDDVEIEVLAAIDDLMSELGAQAFHYGGAMIIESEWEDYAQQVAEDTGTIEEDSPLHPYVDWSGWADALSQDYGSTVFLGESYYVRGY